ncbi:MAG: PHP domain-containing protein [Desulfatibacillum sp.]|nr:PHP domain-containing protein [Desulfatibacillum sp.]
MIIDLHVHTWPRSQCSNIEPRELVARAKKLGLDGFCLTEHQVLWDLEEVRELALDQGIRIFRGNEITTAQGDILVFGLEKDIQGVVTARALQKEVEAAGAFSIAAHPFRGFKTFGVGQLDMNLEQASQKKVFKYVHAIEVHNGKVSETDNALARQVAELLGKPGTGGSDAHLIQDLGTYVTIFEKDIEDDAQLLEELHAGRFSAGVNPD